MSDTVLNPLSTESRRAFAAAAIREADPAVSVPVAAVVVDVLDAVSAAVLGAVAVLSPEAARDVLAVMWAPQGGGETQWG